MSIIQSIRERAAWLVFGLIAVSLIGFLLMDARRSNFFGGNDRTTAVGVIDGKKILAEDFDRQVSAIEEGIKRQQQGQTTVSDEMRQQIREEIWQKDVRESLLDKDYAATGIDVGKGEQNDMLVGQDLAPQIRQYFSDRRTGYFDAQAAAQQINQIYTIYKAGPRKGANADNGNYEIARSFWEDQVPQIVQQRMEQKFVALIANSAYVPKWMAEKVNADNSQIASISFVNTPYITIPDSAAKVSDAEIMEYVNQHPDDFQQKESRSIAYVMFDASPTSDDSLHIRQQMIELSKDFAAAKDPGAFLTRVQSETPYPDTTVAKSMTRVPFKDSIFALQKGGLYGPYLDGGNYVIAKLIDEHQVPDSVEARHILVSMVDRETNQPTMDDSTGKKKIDSIRNLIEKGGQRFDSVAAHLSDDGSKIKGGKLGWFGPNQMVKPFQDFAFGHKVGDKGIVRSQFGYHYIEITGQKNFEPGYKVAYMTRKIDPSLETDHAASGFASQFAGESRDARTFEDNIEKGHLRRLVAPDIPPAAISINGVGTNRQLIRWVYDAEPGNVSEPFPVADKYVVALLTEINKAGAMTAAKARPTVELILRNRKKAEQIIKKLGSPASLDAAASTSGQPVMHADTVNFSAGFIQNAGREPKVVGASFDKALIGKPASPAIAGTGGVFVIRVEKVSALSNPNGDIQQQRIRLEQEQRQTAYQVVDQMVKLANITDNRGKFF
ncbi:MAG TPA: SurA N-terminal domain-containing protein [Puia sp.]|jgi:peptidyl-prolyl cis-trans isomerase D|nr:SurA N-terminal domain-containing protein [Puia sp.]